jgi:esterase/lipase superfamily enzyme
VPKYWLISNRNTDGNSFGSTQDQLSYWVSDKIPLDQFKSWKRVTGDDFRKMLIGAADKFPALDHSQNEDQRHVTLFVHGYNVGWQDAARRYQKLCSDLFSGKGSLGICVAFDWPSFGDVLGYYPDRARARESAGDLAEVLSDLYDWLLQKQQATVLDPKNACKAKVSLIAHSMGNYVLQKAMATAWTRKNQPLLASLINQLLMIAADVDNDLFQPQASDASDGDAVANLTYRLTALYSGRDAVLGVSAGLKHFGTRRLGRSGLAVNPPTDKDNIWEVDCSGFFPGSVGGMDIHSAYFETASVVALIRNVLRGLDRKVLDLTGSTKGAKWP